MLFSFEEPKRIVFWRLLSRISQIPLVSFFRRDFYESQRASVEAAINVVKGFDLTVFDKSMGAAELCDVTEQLNDDRKVDFVVVDLITKVRGDGRSLREQTANISNRLSTLPGLIEAPVLALHQLNRKIEDDNRKDKMPRESDLREAGQLEEDAKGILFLLRPSKYNPEADPHEMAVRMAKNTNGPIGTIDLWCDVARMTVRAKLEESHNKGMDYYNGL